MSAIVAALTLLLRHEDHTVTVLAVGAFANGASLILTISPSPSTSHPGPAVKCPSNAQHTVKRHLFGRNGIPRLGHRLDKRVPHHGRNSLIIRCAFYSWIVNSFPMGITFPRSVSCAGSSLTHAYTFFILKFLLRLLFAALPCHPLAAFEPVKRQTGTRVYRTAPLKTSHDRDNLQT